MEFNMTSAKIALLNVLDEPVTNGGKEGGREGKGCCFQEVQPVLFVYTHSASFLWIE